jgi:hypothetical protein
MPETHTVEADFSQFYLSWRTDASGQFDPDGPGTALVRFSDRTMIMFTAMRQHGPIDVDVSITTARPEPLGVEWGDVSELSFVPSSAVALTGWEARGDDPVLALTPGTSYRLRYGIAEADLARDVSHKPFPERYLLEFWPEPESPPEQVVQRSSIGRYWTGSRAITAIRGEFVAEMASSSLTDDEKVEEFAARVFTALPYVVTDIAESTFHWPDTMWNPMILGVHTTVSGDEPRADVLRQLEEFNEQKARMTERFRELAAAWPEQAS